MYLCVCVCVSHTTGGDGLFMVVDHQSTFRDDNFQKAIAQLNDVDGSGGKVRHETSMQR